MNNLDKAIKDLDMLAFDCVMILKSHDMLNNGEDIGDSELAVAVKEISDIVNKDIMNGDGVFLNKPLRSLVLKHSVMLAEEVKALSCKYEIFSNADTFLFNPITGIELLRLSLRFSVFDYDNRKSSSEMEEMLVEYLMSLTKNE